MMDLLKNVARKALPKAIVDHLRLIYRPPVYNQDGLITWHNCDFLSDPRFMSAYSQGKRTGSYPKVDIHWRSHVACWAAARCKNLEGDFVECGVYLGGLSRTIMEYIDFKTLHKTFFLFDTFNGLSDKHISAEERKLGISREVYSDYAEDSYARVKETFKDFPNVTLVRGTVPETLSRFEKDGKVSYLSIDMNCRDPEISAAEFFWDKMVSGGIMLLDDYGFGEVHRMQREGFDAFAARKDVEILVLPTGQGLIMKP